MYVKLFKRVVDVLISVFLLLTLLPVVIIIYLALLTARNQKPFFLQKRIGQYNKPFLLIKFRSMENDKQSSAFSISKKRITRFGGLLRKSSLDELPQLINVIKGDMSLIGPRPLYEHYLPFYSDEESKRHSVRPGISGWAQVNGRNTISWDSKLKMDVFYVKNISFRLDFFIAYKTVINTLYARDVIVDELISCTYLNEERQDHSINKN